MKRNKQLKKKEKAENRICFLNSMAHFIHRNPIPPHLPTAKFCSAAGHAWPWRPVIHALTLPHGQKNHLAGVFQSDSAISSKQATGCVAICLIRHHTCTQMGWAHVRTPCCRSSPDPSSMDRLASQWQEPTTTKINLRVLDEPESSSANNKGSALLWVHAPKILLFSLQLWKKITNKCTNKICFF